MKRTRSCAFWRFFGLILLSLCLLLVGCERGGVDHFSYLNAEGISAEIKGERSGEQFAAKVMLSREPGGRRVTLCYLSPEAVKGLTLSALLGSDGSLGDVTVERDGTSATLPFESMEGLLKPALSFARKETPVRVQKEGEGLCLVLADGGELILCAQGKPLEYREDGFWVRVLSWERLST